jgi:SPP1 gp7 family putative phage head morphogenesis protein
MKFLWYTISRQTSDVLAKTDKAPPQSKGKANPALINIVASVKDNSRKDIQKWRQALEAMQHPTEPKYAIFYDLLEDLLTDGHLQSQIQMRKMSTLNTDFQIINRKTGVINEGLTFVFQQQWFYQFLEHALDAVLFGTTVIEFQELNNDKIKIALIPRRNVLPTLTKIIPDLTKTAFVNYSDPVFANWLIQIGDSKNIGILNNIIPNLIWMRNVAQSWAEFCEKFGFPLITATTNTTDTATIDKVHNMLSELSEAMVGTFPHGTEIKFNEAERTDAYNTYMQFIKLNADIISKQLVGSTILSDQGNNRSTTEVHERTLDSKIAQTDKRGIQFVINNQLLPLLKNQNYAVSDDDRFEFKTAEQEVDLKELWNITSGLLGQGFGVEQDWISKTFNIPISKKVLDALEKKKPDNNPNINAVASLERYPFACDCGGHVMALGSTIRKIIDALTSQLITSVYNKTEVNGILGQFIVAEGLELLQGLRANFKTFSPYTGPDLLALQMMEYNLFEFTASKAEARLAAMSDLLIDSDTSTLRSFSDFKGLCEEKMTNLNTNWLETEYNLSVAVGQNSAAYTRFLSEKDTVTSFVQYQTIGDDKVRDQHKVLDGLIFNLSDKEAMQLWPPNGFGCRCEMLQYIGDTKGMITTGKQARTNLTDLEPRFVGSQFDINRGDLKQVFTKKQFYSENKKLPEKLNLMTYDKYNLKPYSDFKASLKPLEMDKTITSDNVKELFKKFNKESYMGFEDYLGRKMTLSEKVFNEHTTGKYTNASESRHQLFPHVKDILNNPDEVWYNNPDKLENKFQSRYVKFYKDEIIIIDCKIDEKQGLEIRTWYAAKKEDLSFRKGLLVRNKVK